MVHSPLALPPAAVAAPERAWAPAGARKITAPAAASAASPRTSPLRGLLSHGPRAGAQADKEGLEDARSGVAENFLRAAGLGGTGAASPVRTPARPAAEASGLAKAGRVSAFTQAEVLTAVVKEMGPLISREDAPVLFRTVETVFGRLSRAQQKLFPSDVLSLNRVHIIDSPVLNAFVYPQKQAGVRRVNNMVFLTTGLIRKMFGDKPDGKAMKLAETRMAGILAHELAHPLDKADSEGFSKNHLRQVSSQAEEIRADSEGMVIAREAGYPPEAIYEGLKRLFAGESRETSTLQASASTHPQDFLRLAVQRMLLTLQRYAKGKLRPKFPGAVRPGLLRELESLDKSKRLWTFQPPATLLEAFERIERIRDIKERGEAYRVVEFNRLLLTIDEMLLKRGEELTDEEFEAFTEFAGRLAREDDLPALNRDGMNKRFTKDTLSLEFLERPSHFTYLKKIPVYRSEKYRAWARDNFFNKSGYGDTDTYFEQLVKILPAELIIEEFGDKIVESLLSDMRMHGNLRYQYEDALKRMPVELHVRMAVLFHKKMLPRLTEGEKLVFFADGISDRATYALPQKKHKGSSHGILASRMEFMGDPRQRDLQEAYREVLQAVWKDRGYYGAVDVVLQFGNTDWETIFAVLGIDKRVGYGQLRQEVKKFTRSERYADLVEVIQKGAGKGSSTIRPGMRAAKFNGIPWADDTLAPYLSGDLNERIRTTPELRAVALANFNATYLTQAKHVFRRMYAKRLRAALADHGAKPLPLERLTELHSGFLFDIAGKAGTHLTTLRNVQAELIDESALPPKNKRELLEALFVKAYGKEKSVDKILYAKKGDWIRNEEEDSGAIMSVLLKNGVVPDVIAFFQDLADEYRGLKGDKSIPQQRYFSSVGMFQDALQRDLEAALSQASTDRGRLRVLRRFARNILDPGDGRYFQREVTNSRELRALKAAVAALADGLEAPHHEKLALFRHLAASGPTEKTDAYFKSALADRFTEPFDSRTYKELRRILEGGLLSSALLKLEWTERFLEPEILHLEKHGADAPALHDLIERINRYVPTGTLKKDDFLESLAWRLDISGKELEVLIEDEKSYNWKKSNPILVNMGSGLTNELAKLKPDSRKRFIRFLIDPENRELPPELLREFERSIYDQILAKARAEESHSDTDEMKAKARKAAYLMKLQLEAALRDASPFERIPVFELLLAAGGGALAEEAGYPYTIIREFLGYEKDSDNERMLIAFLKVIPAHERSVSLAYMLSQVGEDKSSVKSIFEVFQTVGIKFGQLSSTWKLFGEEVAKETASLKDDARPMTKFEILEVARRELTAKEFARIKRFKRILGSASIKTVVEVELVDGGEAVMMVQRPDAERQVESNLDLTKVYLKELKRQGVDLPSAMIDSILDAVREQLGEELQMSREALRIHEAKTLYRSLNRSMRSTLGGWRFEVPGLVEGFEVRDSILFMEKAEGVTFDKLSAEGRSQAGPALVGSSLRTLFRSGWFDADRHTGNQLIDERNKVIYIIDFGQTQDYSKRAFWRSDDRYVLAQFVRALREGKPAAIVRFALEMNRDGAPADAAALRAEVAEAAASEKHTFDKLIAVVNVLAEQGIALEKKFAFGALKGLITLYGEEYVSSEEFSRFMAREVRRRLKAKFPRTLLDR